MDAKKSDTEQQQQSGNELAAKKADTKDAVKAAHDQAEADIEADIELTDAAGPEEDFDEEESIQKGKDASDII